jgi:predicted NUDIX family NTP pyrophosphohydrolase
VPAKRSAGLLVFRRARDDQHQVLLVHPGGPYWARRDERAWSIPKGEYDDAEDALAAARREFAEELGVAPPDGTPIDLGTVVQKSGKHVHAWALEGELDISQITSNTFEIEWPPRSGTRASFPEVDRAEWFDLATARAKLVAAQAELVDRLAEHLAAAGPRGGEDGSQQAESS